MGGLNRLDLIQLSVQRCPDCGGLVQLPCRGCAAKAGVQAKLAAKQLLREKAKQKFSKPYQHLPWRS